MTTWSLGPQCAKYFDSDGGYATLNQENTALELHAPTFLVIQNLNFVGKFCRSTSGTVVGVVVVVVYYSSIRVRLQ